MRKFLTCLSSFLFAVTPLLSEAASAADQSKDDDRLKNCGRVLKEILDVPDDIPQDLLDKADCVVVFPSVLKAAFIVGGSYGRGAMSCRLGEDFRGPWGAPTMMALEGGSFGFQIGGQATDFVLLVMNESGARGILASKVKLGGDISAAAGPVGRDSSAETTRPAFRNPELLAGPWFVRRRLSRGLHNPSGQWRQRERVRQKGCCEGHCSVGKVPVPPAAQQLVSTLDARTPKHKS